MVTMAETTPETTSETISHMEVDTRRPEWCRNHVKLIEVIRAFELEHREDFNKSITAMRGGLMGLFMLESENYERYRNKSVFVRGVELKITPRIQKEREGPSPIYGRYNQNHRYHGERREGTLVTIWDSYKFKVRHISNELFDEHFQNIEGVEVIKQTQPQKTPGSSTLNNNRYLVVKNEAEDKSKIDLGSSVEIMGQSWNLSYRGIQKYCFLCDEKHGWECPSKKRFESLKEQRKGKTGHRKMYTDSSFRNTNQLALTTDVECMSGGGMGQICNIVALDTKHDEVIIHAGNNEILNTKSLSEFVYTVEKASEKLRKLAEETKVTVVLPCAPTMGADEDCKAKFFEEKMKEIDTIQTIKLKKIEYDCDHPSEKGTQEMIEQIQTAIGEKIVLEGAEQEVTTKRKYSQVQPMYKVGCRGCSTLDFTPQLCSACKEEAQSVDTQYLEDMIKKLEEQTFPNLESENDFDIKGLTKRGRRNDSDDESNPKNVKYNAS